MNIPEPQYFSLFTKTISLYWITALLLAVSIRLLKKRRLVLPVLIFCILLILSDLMIFGRMILGKVTLTKEKVPFDEQITPFSLPEKRKGRILFTDEFRYFRPALINEHSAFDSTRLVHFDRQDIVAPIDDTIRLIREGRHLFYPDLLSRTFTDFVQSAKTNYKDWDINKKAAYLNIVEIGMEALIAEALYGSGLKFESVLKAPQGILLYSIKKNLLEEYRALMAGRDSLERVGDIVDAWNKLMNPKADAGTDKDDFSGVVVKYASMYRAFNAGQCLLRIYNRFHLSNVNTFVRLKDYDRLVQLYRSSRLAASSPAIYRRIRGDCGITSPIIGFYAQAEAIDIRNYFENLSRGRLDMERLYLHSSQEISKMPKDSNKGFSYTIVNYNPNILEFVYESGNSGYLYISDGYDRHWHARVDGNKTRVYKANAAFKAIKAPEGRHKVRFVYKPAFFRASLWIYYLTVVSSLLFLIVKPGFSRNQTSDKILKIEDRK